MPARAVMFQGTASHVGKSVMTAAFCRMLRRKGIKVAPFKGMNMSNNAWVTEDGGEIACAQAVQAKACGVIPTVDMNPVLLKTMSDQTSQVIVHGKPEGVVAADELGFLRERLLTAIEVSLKRILDAYDVVVIEGAGSPAEINLQETDLANMRVARMARAPVVLVADIERGGVFAQIVGTLELLSPEDRNQVSGFLINKFRGDPSLLQSGIDWLEARTGTSVFGVVPYLHEIRIPQEDALGIPSAEPSQSLRPSVSSSCLQISVIRYPTISNFTDFEPLAHESDVELTFLQEPPSNWKRPDLVILPGSKSTMADLAWLKGIGWEAVLRRWAAEGVEILGVCGGFQMLGEWLYDPEHAESKESAMRGLGLLPTSTLFLKTKVTAQVAGVHVESGKKVQGYEIHMGRVQGLKRGTPVFRITQRGGEPVNDLDGCRLSGKSIWGTYLHGLFDEEEFRRDFIRRRLPPGSRTADPESSSDPYDSLADQVSSAMDWGKIGAAIPWIR